MYDVKQFKPALYILLAMGFSGFTLAVGAPGLFLLSMGLLGLNVWLVNRGFFRPLPRWVANGLTLVATLYSFSRLWQGGPAIFPIGEFLLILQLVKVYEQRANRDYAQLLVLSLLLMVAAAISTAVLLFGLLFIAYLLLSLYCCLLFHLKVETDHARSQMGLDERRISPMTLRQDQRFLNRSMTHVTSFVSMFAIVMSILVFLFFPRGDGRGLLGSPFKSAQASTGFSDSGGDLSAVTRIAQNNAVVGYLNVTKNGQSFTSGEIYLRGQVYDSYNSPNANNRFGWTKSQRNSSPFGRNGRVRFEQLRANGDVILGVNPEPGQDVWVQEFRELRQTTASGLLFSMGGIVKITSDRDLRLTFNEAEQVLSVVDGFTPSIRYTVTSTDTIKRLLGRMGGGRYGGGSPEEWLADRAYLGDSTIDPEVARIARRPEVSGVGDDGKPLYTKVVHVADQGMARPINGEIATHIENYLKTQFSYTLDLTDVRRVDDKRDPLVGFLTDWKRGHCEFFASAMVVMCQSLGVPARRVDGFKVDEYNGMGGYWVVRQSHAHSWVEVLTDNGWERFDPTSGNGSYAAVAKGGFFISVKHFFDYLEQAWSSSVIAYDASAQTNLLDRVENGMSNTANKTNSALADVRSNWFGLRGWLDDLNLYSISSKVIGVAVVVMILGGIAMIGTYLYQQWLLRRRARRIGLGELRPDEQIRLARQLSFYDQLVRSLERHRIVRAPHQTPLEFGQSLTFLPAEAYDTIVRLTRIFYRVRFGEAKLAPSTRKRLDRVVQRIEHTLDGSTHA
ncbi:MAG: transglutaminaseTgpA domain-containing protein [Tepidisphaeraceae bacterium]